jgi:hypothetical protein
MHWKIGSWTGIVSVGTACYMVVDKAAESLITYNTAAQGYRSGNTCDISESCGNEKVEIDE